VLFVIGFPAGVLVYWITTNMWTMGQQYVIKRRIGPVTPAAAGPAVGAGTSVVPTGKSPPSKSDAKQDGDLSANGSGSGGGLGGLIRGRSKAKEETPVITPTRSAPPPRPPRKKKKRSGRRR
jgi:YidC/Oxa1 family membrane protein insertase